MNNEFYRKMVTLSKLGWVDAEMIENNGVFIAKEKHEFLNAFDVEGIPHGLDLNEIQRLKEAFLKGYKTECAWHPSDAPERFFRLFNHIATLRHMAQVRLGGGNANDAVLSHFLKTLNHEIHD